jgi:hypothetical protein
VENEAGFGRPLATFFLNGSNEYGSLGQSKRRLHWQESIVPQRPELTLNQNNNMCSPMIPKTQPKMQVPIERSKVRC